MPIQDAQLLFSDVQDIASGNLSVSTDLESTNVIRIKKFTNPIMPGFDAVEPRYKQKVL